MKDEIRTIALKIGAIQSRIVDYSRTLIPHLKDHGAPNAAKQLEELFFELDAATGEISALYDSDPRTALAAIFEQLKRVSG